MSNKYDSRIETYKHIQVVQNLVHEAVTNLMERALVHDSSKLQSPEVECFDEYTPKLAQCTYGSDEYKGFLAAMKPALTHHYARNSHHSEHYPNGIRRMSLLDLIEMLADWKAASLRQHDGNILKSIEFNQDRYGFSNELKDFLINTINELGWGK